MQLAWHLNDSIHAWARKSGKLLRNENQPSTWTPGQLPGHTRVYPALPAMKHERQMHSPLPPQQPTHCPHCHDYPPRRHHHVWSLIHWWSVCAVGADSAQTRGRAAASRARGRRAPGAHAPTQQVPACHRAHGCATSWTTAAANPAKDARVSLRHWTWLDPAEPHAQAEVGVASPAAATWAAARAKRPWARSAPTDASCATATHHTSCAATRHGRR
mmetsp:Transcript_14777/g.43380  ORF Transcript_14777/g.43380 Transcript_14777/m.43380 type:complete len:216 (+) Transcript_14777:1562-2209(+)